jgi:hypothetical protein|tara:strand:+ start:203 stop:436 length:234 start_codon:yes stop_codon:yes gene_type:complete
MVAAHIVNGVAGEHIEIFRAILVIEILPNTADVDLVKTDQAQYPGELGIDILALESDVLTIAAVDELLEIKAQLPYS